MVFNRNSRYTLWEPLGDDKMNKLFYDGKNPLGAGNSDGDLLGRIKREDDHISRVVDGVDLVVHGDAEPHLYHRIHGGTVFGGDVFLGMNVVFPEQAGVVRFLFGVDVDIGILRKGVNGNGGELA